jgi:hypothetical protein
MRSYLKKQKQKQKQTSQMQTAHAYNPSYSEAEIRRMSVWGQIVPETLSQKSLNNFIIEVCFVSEVQWAVGCVCEHRKCESYAFSLQFSLFQALWAQTSGGSYCVGSSAATAPRQLCSKTTAECGCWQLRCRPASLEPELAPGSRKAKVI